MRGDDGERFFLTSLRTPRTSQGLWLDLDLLSAFASFQLDESTLRSLLAVVHERRFFSGPREFVEHVFGGWRFQPALTSILIG